MYRVNEIVHRTERINFLHQAIATHIDLEKSYSEQNSNSSYATYLIHRSATKRLVQLLALLSNVIKQRIWHNEAETRNS